MTDINYEPAIYRLDEPLTGAPSPSLCVQFSTFAALEEFEAFWSEVGEQEYSSWCDVRKQQKERPWQQHLN